MNGDITTSLVSRSLMHHPNSTKPCASRIASASSSIYKPQHAAAASHSSRKTSSSYRLYTTPKIKSTDQTMSTTTFPKEKTTAPIASQAKPGMRKSTNKVQLHPLKTIRPSSTLENSHTPLCMAGSRPKYAISTGATRKVPIPINKTKESFMELLDRSASTIQKWYRKILKDRQSGFGQLSIQKMSYEEMKESSSYALADSQTSESHDIEAHQRRQKLERLLGSAEKPPIAPSAESHIPCDITATAYSELDTCIQHLDTRNTIESDKVHPLPTLEYIPHHYIDVSSRKSPIQKSHSVYEYEDDFESISTQQMVTSEIDMRFEAVQLDDREREDISKDSEDNHSEDRQIVLPPVSLPEITPPIIPSGNSILHGVDTPIQISGNSCEHSDVTSMPKSPSEYAKHASQTSLSATSSNSTKSYKSQSKQAKYRFDMEYIPAKPQDVNSSEQICQSLPYDDHSNRFNVSIALQPDTHKLIQQPHIIDQKNKTPPTTIYTYTSGSTKSNSTLEDSVVSKRVGRILDLLKTVDDEDKVCSSSAVTCTPNPQSLKAISEFLNDQTMSDPNLAIRNNPVEHTVAIFDGVKSKIMSQQMEIEEKIRMIDLLKKELKKVRDSRTEQDMQQLSPHNIKPNLTDYVFMITSLQKSLKSQLSLQRKEYETIIKRHLAFIDKLLSEKEELSKKCEELAAEVKQMEKQFSNKIKGAEEQQSRDLKKQREMWQAAEKIKRDKWIQDKTKLIKDQTVKGLEPEIQRMISQHKAQVSSIEERYREQLIKEKNMLAENHQRQMEDLRDRSVAERQKACEDEREFCRQRYLKQLERDEMEFQQQKRKICSEFDEQKHNLIESIKEERKLDEQSHRKSIEEIRQKNEEVRASKELALDELAKKHTGEKQFKEKLIKERDTELEMIIQRLESESNSNSSDATRKYRMDMERLKADTADEIKHLRDQHSMALDKVLAAQGTISQLEDHRRNLQKEILKTQHETCTKDAIIRQQKSELARLKVDEQTLMNTIRHEFNEQLDTKDKALHSINEQMRVLQEQTEILRRKYQQELNVVISDKEDTMVHIEERVKQALRQKDDTIKSLRSKQEDLALRNGHLEAMIEKQRQELLL
ncbi:hypothetical protein BSLG_006928 [Batrachochytrium salamandrivorans]|nr:hypothetical protein BSLG_006928 [Batrachochytrium salamandrivorans]